MKRHKKTLCRFLAVGVLMGVLFMGAGPFGENPVATVHNAGGSPGKAPVISDKNIEELRGMARTDRVMM